MAELPKGAAYRENRLLASLPPEDLAHLTAHLEPVELRSGRILYEPGQAIQHGYFPLDALISLVAVLEDGGAAEVGVFGREGVLGYLSTRVRGGAFGRYVVQIPGSALRIAVQRLQEAADARPSIQRMLQCYTEALLAQTFQTVACNAVHSVEARCCRWILATQYRVGRNELLLTHEFLAEMLGVQRSTVTVVTRTLQTAGLIAQRRGVITVVDPARLEEAACECHGAIRRNFERLLPRTYSGG